jgi:hypothetical protein
VESRDCCVCPSLCLAVVCRWRSRGRQVLLSMIPLSLLELFRCNCTSVASYTMMSTQTFTLAGLSILLTVMLCLVCVLSSATAHLSGWPRWKCLMCPLHLNSTLLRVCPPEKPLQSSVAVKTSKTYRQY